MIKTKENWYWETQFNNSGEVIGAVRKLRTEKYIHVKLPWKIWAYSINNDSVLHEHPTFGIYWYNPAHWTGWTAPKVFRFGWVYGPKSVGKPKNAHVTAAR